MGEIIGRFERKGFTLKALKLFRPSKELAEEHYKDLSSKPFFKDLVDYITSGPVVAMVGSYSFLLLCVPVTASYQGSTAPALRCLPTLLCCIEPSLRQARHAACSAPIQRSSYWARCGRAMV